MGQSLSPHIPQPGSIVMYSTTWCGYCRTLKNQLDRESISYTEINVEQVPESALYVETVNGGNRVVPTVVFSDGTSATNPSLAVVKERMLASATV
ncbi:mycoredoxin [Timonella sp. A28]|uniref:mycoredoxin n=1 Tax=Timonella sp. A28 TaxID=3442640 RepID=UPI003EC01A54